MRPYNDTIAHSGRPARVVGQVVDVLDRPVVRSMVILQRGLTPAARIAAVLSDSLGRFELDSVTPDEYVLNVRGIGYQQQWHSLRLVGAASDTICVRMRAMPIGLAPVGH